MALQLWGFGANHAGQLGVDVKESNESCPTPVPVRLPDGLVPRKVACGKIFSVSLSENSPAILLSGMQDVETGAGHNFGINLCTCS